MADSDKKVKSKKLKVKISIQNYKIMSNKTNKSFLKRIKITGSGKILKRPPGQNHFNAKDSGSKGQRKHGNVAAPSELINKVKALIRQTI